MPSNISRRTFLNSATGAVAAGLIGGSKSAAPAAMLSNSADPDASPLHISLGIVGVGMQGSVLLRDAVAIPGVRCIAAADLYDERHQLAKEIAGSQVSTTRRYQDLLDNKEIDCLIVATPDHWHKKVVVDALKAGKDVYCEKPMSHSIADGAEMVRAVQETGRIVQVGSQTVTSPVYQKAKELIAAGRIGKVSLVEMSTGRNDPTGAWEYPVPANISEQNLDWNTWLGDTRHRPFDPVIFARWRAYRAYGTGVAGDLMVHLLSGMQCALGSSKIPDRVLASGGLIRWKDGREYPDLHLALLEYGDLVVSIRVTLDTETPNTTRILGSHGAIEISGGRLTCTLQRGIDTKPSYYDSGFPQAMREEYERQWHAENDITLEKLPPLEDTETFQCVSCNDNRRHLSNFFHAVQTRAPVEEDALFGHHAAAACHMANESYFSRQIATRPNPAWLQPENQQHRKRL